MIPGQYIVYIRAFIVEQKQHPNIHKYYIYIYVCNSVSITLCSKYGFGIVMSEGIIYLRLRIRLLVGMSWADVWSVMLARGVMCDVRHPRQEEAL